MLTKRIIPCLDVTDGRVVKGTNFVNLRDAGDPVELARFYDRECADELVFLDITASSDHRATMVDVVSRTADQVFIPLTVGGGIRTVDDMRRMLQAGADKVSINTAAIHDPSLIERGAERFGSQCIVVAIDAKRVTDGLASSINIENAERTQFAENGQIENAKRTQFPAARSDSPRPAAQPSHPLINCLSAGGARPFSENAERTQFTQNSQTENPARTQTAENTNIENAERSQFPRWQVFTHGGRRPTGIDAVEWAMRCEALGAGEILLTSMDADGTLAGYDLPLTAAISSAVNIPVIASGGAGDLQHLCDGVVLGKADAVLVASIFHYGTYTIRQAKEFMAARGIPIRF